MDRSERLDLDARNVSFDAQMERVYRRAVRARALAEADNKLAENMEANVPGDAYVRDGLSRLLWLTPEQQDLVWCIVACSFDPRIVPYIEALAGAHGRRGLSVATYVDLAQIDESSATILARWLASPQNPLVSTGLLLVTEQASPAARAYVASSRLVDYLAGSEPSKTIHMLDDGLEIEPPLRVVRVSRPLLHDARQLAAIDTIGAAFGRDSLIVIEGPLGSGRVTACACATGQDMIVLDCQRVPAGEIGAALVSLRRELLLRPGVAVLANADCLVSEEQREPRRVLGEFIDHYNDPLVVTVTVPGTDLGTERSMVRITWGVPDSDVRARLWAAAVESHDASARGDLHALAYRYRVGPAAISRAVASAGRLHRSKRVFEESDLAAGLRQNIAERLGGLARRIEVTQTWRDLVTGDDLRDEIAALVARIKHAHRVFDQWGYRAKLALGAGAAALFSGPPGTGKTMVAGLIARELDLELYQVDLSKVVSKWVGETEKNLARVFDAAEEGHSLLLFDEADSLFGQRTADVKSATDRYANLEVNYLLQRVEAFGGITILTTNLETAIDDALKRRLASHIVFEKPDDDQRAQIWERQLTTGRSPVARDINYDDLSRKFPQMSGANIRNAAIAAAFLAAGEDASLISQEHVLRAARVEYRSMGHVFADSKRGGSL